MEVVVNRTDAGLLISYVAPEKLAHARAIGALLRKSVTNCEKMMSWYFPI